MWYQVDRGGGWRLGFHSDEMTIRVLAAVIQEGGKYLVCRRPPHKRHGGLWEFPGGKLEAGESDLEAAQRELREELDVQVTGIGSSLLVVRDPGSPFEIAFVEVHISGTPVCREHIELSWRFPSELSALPLAPSDLVFVEEALKPPLSPESR